MQMFGGTRFRLLTFVSCLKLFCLGPKGREFLGVAMVGFPFPE